MKPRTKDTIKGSGGRFSILLPLRLRQPLIDLAARERRSLSAQVELMLERALPPRVSGEGDDGHEQE